MKNLMHIASQHQNIECMKILLDYGADVRSQSTKRRTALDMCMRGVEYELNSFSDTMSPSETCVKMLIDRKADVDVRDLSGTTPLMHACILGRTDCLKHLLTTRNLTYRDDDYMTALAHACRMKREGCVRHLLNAKADPISDPRNSALIVATMADSQACCKLLLEAGADANYVEVSDDPREQVQDGYGYNALMVAIIHVARTCFDLLLEKTSDRGVNQIAANGMTPLLLACKTCYDAGWVQALIKREADVNKAVSTMGEDALTLCIAALAKSEKYDPGWLLNQIINLGVEKVTQEIQDITLSSRMKQEETIVSMSFLHSLNGEMTSAFMTAFFKAYGREIGRCVNHLLNVETLDINRMPMNVNVTPLDVAFKGALKADETLPIFKSIMSKMCRRGARMHRPLNTIRTQYPVNFSEMKKMVPLLESISKSQGAGYYTLDFLVGDAVSFDWKDVIKAFLQKEGLEDPPPRDHPVFHQYQLLKLKEPQSPSGSTVRKDNGFMESSILVDDLMIPTSVVQNLTLLFKF